MNVSLSPPSASAGVWFRSRGVYTVKVEGEEMEVLQPHRQIECEDGATLKGNDLLGAIRNERANPVGDQAVSDPNIKDGAVTIAKVDPTDPLPVFRGGTGLASVTAGGLLVGDTDDSLKVSGSAAWIAASKTLEVTGGDGLSIGDTRVAIDTDPYGNRSLFAFNAAGTKTNMIAPGLAAPEVVNGEVSFDSSTNALRMTVAGGHPVDAFFAWSTTVASLNRESVVAPGMAEVTRSGRVRFRGSTAEHVFAVETEPPPGSKLFGVLRDARGTCSKVATGDVPP